MEDQFLQIQNWFLANEELLSSMAAMLAVVTGCLIGITRFLQLFRKKSVSAPGDFPATTDPQTELDSTSPLSKESKRIIDNKHTIAVLPLRSLTSTGDEDYLATGIAEDIITSLSYSRLFPVISSATSFQYSVSESNLYKISQELKAKYVVTGTIGRAQEFLNLSIALADSDSQRQLWSERFSCQAADVFNLQEQVSEKIIGKLSPALRTAGMGSARRVAPNHSDAWDHVLRGTWHQSQHSAESNVKAIAEYEKAIGIDSQFGYTYAVMAYAYHLRTYMGWSVSFQDDMRTADEYARKAISLDPDVAEAYLVLGLNALFMRKFDVAENMATTAVELNPCNGLCWLAIGLVALYRDRHEEAIEHFVRVERLNPRDPLQWLFQVAASLAHFFKGDFDASLQYARLAQVNPLGKVSGDLLEVASLSAQKRYDDATALLAANPPKHRSWDFVLTRLPFENSNRRQLLVDHISQVDETVFAQPDKQFSQQAL